VEAVGAVVSVVGAGTDRGHHLTTILATERLIEFFTVLQLDPDVWRSDALKKPMEWVWEMF